MFAQRAFHISDMAKIDIIMIPSNKSSMSLFFNFDLLLHKLKNCTFRRTDKRKNVWGVVRSENAEASTGTHCTIAQPGGCENSSPDSRRANVQSHPQRQTMKLRRCWPYLFQPDKSNPRRPWPDILSHPPQTSQLMLKHSTRRILTRIGSRRENFHQKHINYDLTISLHLR